MTTLLVRASPGSDASCKGEVSDSGKLSVTETLSLFIVVSYKIVILGLYPVLYSSNVSVSGDSIGSTIVSGTGSS
jgi:hypothetical protein